MTQDVGGVYSLECCRESVESKSFFCKHVKIHASLISSNRDVVIFQTHTQRMECEIKLPG